MWMTQSLVRHSPLRARFRFIALVVVLGGAAACYSRGMRPEPRRGMDGFWCPEDSVRMAHVINRGPGPARLMIRRVGSNVPPAELAVVAPRETGEYRLADSVLIGVYDPETATPVPRGHAPALPTSGVPRPKVEIEYFCR